MPKKNKEQNPVSAEESEVVSSGGVGVKASVTAEGVTVEMYADNPDDLRDIRQVAVSTIERLLEIAPEEPADSNDDDDEDD